MYYDISGRNVNKYYSPQIGRQRQSKETTLPKNTLSKQYVYFGCLHNYGVRDYMQKHRQFKGSCIVENDILT